MILFQGMHQFAHWSGRLSDWPGLLGALWVDFGGHDDYFSGIMMIT